MKIIAETSQNIFPIIGDVFVTKLLVLQSVVETLIGGVFDKI